MKRSLRLFLLRWHRRLGVLVALVVVMLVATGVILNHSAELALDQRPVHQPALLSRYGVDLPELHSFRTTFGFLTQVGGSRLYLDLNEIAYCESPFVAGLSFQDGLLALCRDQLLLLTPEGEIVERLGSAYGMPKGITQLGLSGGELWMNTDDGPVKADLTSLVFAPESLQRPVSWVSPEPLPSELKAGLTERFLGNDVNWERLLLDLHSGRLFGQWGVYVVDASAIILLLLALSGAWVWLTKPGRWRR